MKLENEEDKLKGKKIHKKEWIFMHIIRTCWGLVIVFTLWLIFGRNDIFAIMSLQVHEHDAFHHLFDVSVTFLNLILWFFNVNVFHVF